MVLFYFSSLGWAGWDVSSSPSIREGMPVLIDDDLLLEDDHGPSDAALISQWLRELPINGAHGTRTWQAYAFAMKSWIEFLASHKVRVLASRKDLKDGLSLYAQHRLSGDIGDRLSSSSWNMAVKIIAAFYRWAAAEGRVNAEPFSYASQNTVAS
ncbi:site-specific integrase [Micrococcaceae bacterium Sec5.7]